MAVSTPTQVTQICISLLRERVAAAFRLWLRYTCTPRFSPKNGGSCVNCNMYFFLLKARRRAVFLTGHCSPTHAAPKETSCVATASSGHKKFLEAFLPMRSRQAKGS